MAPFNRFRLFHWLLAGFFLAVYLSGDDAELLHIWLGYGLVVLLVLRLLIAPLHLRGFPKLLPARASWRRPDLSVVGRWLTFGALGSFAVAGLIGLGMVDNGDVLAELPGVSPNLFGAASDINFIGWMGDAKDVHEFFANLGLALVGLHIGFILLFRSASVLPMLRGLPRTSKAAPLSPVKGEPGPAGPSAFTRLQVLERLNETVEAASFVLQVPADQRVRFAAQAGQFLTLRIPCSEPPLLRCYSLSRPPRGDGRLQITVKRVADGRASNWLLDHLQAGASLEALPPAGRFVPRSLDGDLLLIGAGSGITPLRAILEQVLEHGSGRVCLWYASPDAERAIFAEALTDLQHRHGQRLQLLQWFDAEQGLPDAARMAAQLAGWRDAECYLCGPQPFMASANQALALLGVSPERIRQESFSAAAATAAASSVGSRLQVRLGGQQHALQVAPGQVLLDAMEQAGLQPPSACRAGVCAACSCRVLEGSVQLRSNQALSDEQLRQGWTLACQAEARSAELEVEYAQQ